MGLRNPDLATCGCEKTGVTLTRGAQTPKIALVEGEKLAAVQVTKAGSSQLEFPLL